MSDTIVELSHVTKRFGDFTAVRDLSFALTRGSILGFLGPNGAGKTTTLRMMLGILPPDEGTIRVLGKSIGEVRERIGYLPEERGLYKRMRADAAIAYLATLKGMNRADALVKARKLLDGFGLGEFQRVRIEGLSKGMAQKVQLLSAVVHDPEFVILDEPFSGLDPVNQTELEAFIRNLAAEGKTILFSTHTMQHAERLCDRLVILAKGSKRFEGTLDEARGLLPRRARLAAETDLSFLTSVPGVERVTAPGAGSPYWTIDLREGDDGRALLAACFDRKVPLTHFDVAPPSLFDVFVSLVGQAHAEEAVAA
ncbi:MAG: ATP-binding cassette domain-containing protein [Alphaproteobacteria bacterium]|nr:ATP-binding cassette domain-containing protein [Alphaproteobacteria bacterium]MBL6940002.1 ATP-binding cassette domain-containing protein [Alphaproteobacteria bacterium]MBL7098142.1 ATP-binding cassette domain-containing protein [Alphaproteobacteria bacterium]